MKTELCLFVLNISQLSYYCLTVFITVYMTFFVDETVSNSLHKSYSELQSVSLYLLFRCFDFLCVYNHLVKLSVS